MEAARLGLKITIQQNVVTTDAIGNHAASWEDYYTCHAGISHEDVMKTTEGESAGTFVDNAIASFTIRYCRKAACLTSTGFRVVWNGELYDILTVDHMNGDRKRIKLKCRKTRR